MQNKSGLIPAEFNVVLKQDAVETKTPGGLIKPDVLMEREAHRAMRGTIVAVADMAFNGDVWPEGKPRPKPGQRIAFALHAGVVIDGEDGESYRIVKDRDVMAVLA